MDNQRLLIWAFFGLMVFMTWQAWIEDYGSQPSAPTPTASESPAPAAPAAMPELGASDDEPDLGTPDLGEPSIAEAVATEDDAAGAGSVIRVRTDVLDVDINTRGGTLQNAVLLNYPISKDRPEDKVVLLSRQPENFGLLKTGLRVRNVEQEPDSDAMYTARRDAFDLGSADALEVVLSWSGGNGLSAEKTYRFRRGSYVIDVSQRLVNDTGDAVEAGPYALIERRFTEPDRSMFDVDSYSFDGPIIYDGDKSQKLDRDDLIGSPYSFESGTGWVATIQHHFLNAVVPPRGEAYRYRVAVDGPIARASAIPAAATRIQQGDTADFSMTLFVGPKLQAQLEEVDEKLTLTVDYGWLTVISDPLFWLLSFVYEFVQNWGLAIIVVTILIKLVFYKLTEASGRSMAKMREIQPRMKALQERYKDDRQALSQAMMELYRREKVNPAAGCLPILIQMPFFLAFYWVLLESVEMRQAPFALWITDLSSRDPYFILPLIMGAAMLFQQKLNPAPADPVQARVMQVMPIIFTGFFAFFPSGLVLYWVTNTVLSIAQQWHINRVVEAEAKRKKQGKRSKSRKKADDE